MSTPTPVAPSSLVAIGPPNTGKSTLFGYFAYRHREFSNTFIERVFRRSHLAGKDDRRLAYLLDPKAPDRIDGQHRPDAHRSIEISHVGLMVGARHFVLIDSPGHPDFIHQMILGLSQANVAVLTIDWQAAGELPSETTPLTYPTTPLTTYHTFLSQTMAARVSGISDFIVAITKMDQALTPARAYALACSNVRDLLASIDESLGLTSTPGKATFVPTAVAPGTPELPPSGVNVTADDPSFDWADTDVVSFEEALHLLSEPTVREGPLRIAVEREFWGIHGTEVVVAGRVLSGTVHRGDTLALNPTGQLARVSSIKFRDERSQLERLERWGPTMYAGAGSLVGLALRLLGRRSDDRLKEAHGRLLLSRPNEIQPVIANVVEALLLATTSFTFKPSALTFKAYCGTQSATSALRRVLMSDGVKAEDAATSESRQVVSVHPGQALAVEISLAENVAIDPADLCAANARVLLVEGNVVVAGGTILKAVDSREPQHA